MNTFTGAQSSVIAVTLLATPAPSPTPPVLLMRFTKTGVCDCCTSRSAAHHTWAAPAAPATPPPPQFCLDKREHTSIGCFQRAAGLRPRCSQQARHILLSLAFALNTTYYILRRLGALDAPRSDVIFATGCLDLELKPHRNHPGITV